jgi:subtilisin family serine protease
MAFRIHTQHYFLKGLLVALAGLTLLHGTVRADDEEEVCAKDEYVVDARSSVGLRKIILKELDDETLAPLQVSESTDHIMVVESKWKEADGELVPADGRWNVCNRYRDARRELLRKKRSATPEHGSELPPRFISCHCNAQLQSAVRPNDGLFNLQSNMDRIRAPAAWDISTGSNQVVVAIIDSGVDYNHLDLNANMWRNPGETAGNGVDDDGNGVVDDVYGYNAINNSGNPMDDNNHGTHCAGVIGARGNDGQGVAGVNWQIKMVAVKFLASNGSGWLSDAIKAVDYVTTLRNRGVNVVATNNSWGGGGYIQPLADAITRSRNAGILFIAAAGNNNNDNDAAPSYPASYQIDNIVSVAALDQYNARASFSNYGATSVHIGAPGVSIPSTTIGNGYQYMSGTSMAAPHVTGVVAALAARSGRARAELRAALLSSAIVVPGLSGIVQGARSLDFLNAIQSLPAGAPPAATPTPTATATPTPTPVPTATPTPSPTPSPTPVVPGVWQMSGTVLNGARVGVAGVTVRVRLAGGEELVRMTNSNGYFSFLEIHGPTDYTMYVDAPGGNTRQYQGYLNSDTYFEFNLEEAERYALKVLVLDAATRAPVAGATVTVAGQSAVSNTQGYATFSINHGTRYTVKAAYESAGYREQALRRWSC